MKIVFKQEIDVVYADDSLEGEDCFVKDSNILKSFHSKTYSDELFSDYLLDGEPEASIFKDSNIRSGVLFFEYSEDKNHVVANIEYETSGVLSDTEIEVLKNYTGDQLTDGIGSNFCQFFESDFDIDIGFSGNYGELEVVKHS